MSISDKTFTVLADLVVQNLPTASNSRQSFEFYRFGLQKQSDGDFSTAFQFYQASLYLETDPFSRSYIFYNLGLVYVGLGQVVQALIYFEKSLDLNPLNPSSLNNIAVLYHKLANETKDLNEADLLFQRAFAYWSESTRLEPFQYLEAQNWLQKYKAGVV